MRKFCLAALLGGVILAVPAIAEGGEEVAARFGVRESVLSISLSPSGSKIAWIAAGPQHSEFVNVVDLEGDGKPRRITTNTEQSGDITRCDWATDSRIVCQLYGVAEGEGGLLLPFTRMFAINDDGSDVRLLSQRQSSRALDFAQHGGELIALDVSSEKNNILMTRQHVKEDSVGTLIANDREGLGVDQVDIVSGRRKVVERPDHRASHYIADENGEVRLKIRAMVDSQGYLTGERVFLLKQGNSHRYEPMPPIRLGDSKRDDFVPVAIDAARNSIFGFDTVNGYDVIVEAPLAGEVPPKVIMARDDVDVDALIRIGRQQRVVGASYATEKRAIEYFDPELGKLAAALSRALPDQPLINIVGASADEMQILVIASSDTDPGTVYLYDKSSRQLQPLLAMRNYLVDQAMGPMQPITYPAADGTEIPGYLTLPPGSDGTNLPAIVLPHGGPAARDEWGFDWLVQFFVARGYAVLQPNYRGSAGYGEAWYGRNGYKEWATAIGDVNDAGRWLVAHGIADPHKLAIAGWSYGGYAALQSQVVAPGLFKAVVAIAPVTDLEYLRGDSRYYVNFELRDRQLGRGPHIKAGSPLQHAEKFVAPVALFHGSLDVNVNVRHSRAMAARLQDNGKQVSYTEYEGLQHGLRDSKVRTEMLIEIDRFLSSALGS